jgi:hypothetical protein
MLGGMEFGSLSPTEKLNPVAPAKFRGGIWPKLRPVAAVRSGGGEQLRFQLSPFEHTDYNQSCLPEMTRAAGRVTHPPCE